MQNNCFQDINTFFGTITGVSSDLRIAKELDTQGHWEFKDFLDIARVFHEFYQHTQGHILDIGANIGTWCVPMSRRYPHRKILAFECQALLIRCLEKTLSTNCLSNIDLLHCVVSNDTNKILVHDIDYDWGANFGAYEVQTPFCNTDWNGRSLHTQTWINQITIDSLDLPAVDFIKLDIEGMEYQALQGAIKTITESRPMIVYENHKTNVELVNQLLTNLGYVSYNSVSQMSLMLPKEKL